MEDLNLKPSVYHTCFIYTEKCMAIKETNPEAAKGICCLQIDDKIYVGNKKLMDKERKVKNKLASDPTKHLEQGKGLKFNRAHLGKNGDVLIVSQPAQIQKLSTLDMKTFTQQQLSRSRNLYRCSLQT